MQQQQASTNQASGSQESWWSLKPQYEGVPNMVGCLQIAEQL